MKQNNFTVRTFESLKQYLSQSSIAPTRYFTRLQLERMGEEILKQEQQLREAVTCTTNIYKNLQKTPQSETIKFYHPLPRHKVTPTIPSFLDNTPHNAREKQSRNGMFTRIILLGALA